MRNNILSYKVDIMNMENVFDKRGFPQGKRLVKLNQITIQ